MTIKVYVDDIKKEEWNKLIIDFEDANYYQTWSYGKILWGENNLSHIVIKYLNDVISIAQVRIIKLPFINKGMAYITGGPLWKKMGNAEDINNFRIIIKSIIKEYVIKRGLYLRIAPNVYEYREDIINILTNEGCIYNDNLPKYRTLIVDLEPTIKQIRSNLDQKWRNQLNKSEKFKLIVKEGGNEELYDMYLMLQKDMLSRKKYITNINYEKYKIINNDLPDNLKLHIMVCLYENEPVSSAILTKIGDTAIYLLGATGKNGLNVKGSYFLQWHAIKYLKDKKCKWYDLGGIDPVDNPGVYHFKSGISGIEVRHIGQYDTCNNIFIKSLVRMTDKFRLDYPIIYKKLSSLR